MIKKKFILTRKAISWGYVSRRSGLSSLTWLAPLYELKWQILNPKDYLPIPNLNVFLFVPKILLFSSKIIISVVQKTQAYFVFLYCTLQIIVFFMTWRYVAALHWARLSALFFQQHWLTSWLCVTILVILTTFQTFAWSTAQYLESFICCKMIWCQSLACGGTTKLKKSFITG